MPLVAALWAEIMDCLGWSPGYAPSEAGLIPKECMRMLVMVDTHGLGYACPQTWEDLMTNELPDLEEGHVSWARNSRPMRWLVRYSGGCLWMVILFMTQQGMKWVVLTCKLMRWGDPTPCRVQDTSSPISASWRSSLRDMPLVEGVSML